MTISYGQYLEGSKKYCGSRCGRYDFVGAFGIMLKGKRQRERATLKSMLRNN